MYLLNLTRQVHRLSITLQKLTINRVKTKLIFKDIDAVILCGGQGTRLRPVVTDKPKVLASFGKSTFLDILIDSLQKTGLGNLYFASGS
jgi:glutamine amidotransferase PdxT